jgi:hypothetical protein
MSVKRFGFMAVEMGFITLDQIIEAMKIQVREDLEKPKHRLVGEILVDLGFMNPSQVDEVLKAMGISS